MSAFPSIQESNAICRPSGDQRGVPVRGPPMFVKGRGLDPSLSHTQISNVPERREANTILFPSEEYCGPLSSCVDEMSFRGRASCTFEPCNPIRQMLPSIIDCVYASWFPRREIVGLYTSLSAFV